MSCSDLFTRTLSSSEKKGSSVKALLPQNIKFDPVSNNRYLIIDLKRVLQVLFITPELFFFSQTHFSVFDQHKNLEVIEAVLS